MTELTPREREVIAMVIDGDSDKVIAAKLTMSYSVVRAHIDHIRVKLGAKSRTHAAVMYVRSLAEERET